MKLEIYRTDSNDKQTIGRFYITGNIQVYTGYTLELPDKDNQQGISRIPAGIYQCKKGKGWKIPYLHIHVLDVPDRSGIRIHRGNYHTDIQGCIILGSDLTDINNDGYVDVINSKKTLNKMLEILPDRFELEIFDEVD